MHQGRLPPAPPRRRRPTYQRAAWHRDELEPPAPEPLTRRAWLAGAGGVVLGASVSWLLASGSSAAASPEEEREDPPALAWALSLREADDDTVLHWAGEVVRLAARYPDRRLVPLLERILAIAIERHGPVADMAGATAARALQLFGTLDVLADASDRLGPGDGKEETRAAIEEALRSRRSR